MAVGTQTHKIESSLKYTPQIIITTYVLKHLRVYRLLFYLFSCQAIRAKRMTEDKDNLALLAIRSRLVTYLVAFFSRRDREFHLLVSNITKTCPLPR